MFKKLRIYILSILILLVILNVVSAVDTTPPRSVTSLKNVTYVSNYIRWTWTDPTNSDFVKVRIYIDGIYKTSVKKGIRSFNATGFMPGTVHQIGTRTVDSSGNINKVMAVNAAKTANISVSTISPLLVSPPEVPTTISVPVPTIGTTTTPSLGVFYYPWTGGKSENYIHWIDNEHNPPKTWFGNYLPDYVPQFDPSTELYSSKDTTIIKKQLGLMKRAGIGFAISSWWGQGKIEDQALDIIFNQVLPATDNPYPGIKFSIYYEKEGFADVPKAEIISDINYIKNKYANSPYYYKIGGKPVIFVYNADAGGLADAQKWKQVRDETGIYTVLKVFNGYQSYTNLADGWHQYSPTTSYEAQGTYSAFISPGYHKGDEAVRLAREDFVRFENDAIKLKNANVQFKLIETWNEWGEGTGIEPAQRINHDDVNGFTAASPSYGTSYIDILGKYFSS